MTVISAQRVHATLVGNEWRPAGRRPLPRAGTECRPFAPTYADELLCHALGALLGQTLDPSRFEIPVIVDDEVPPMRPRPAMPFEEWGSSSVTPTRRAGGLASARNHGLLLGGGDIVLFLDDDDVADPHSLEMHLDAHRRFPGEQAAELGRTLLPLSVEAPFLMAKMPASAASSSSIQRPLPARDHDDPGASGAAGRSANGSTWSTTGIRPTVRFRRRRQSNSATGCVNGG